MTKLIPYIKRISAIVLLWIIGMLLYFNLIFLTITEVAPDQVDFGGFYTTAILLGLIFGILNGILEVFILKRKFIRMRFGIVILLKTFLFFVTFLLTVGIFIFIKHTILFPLGIVDSAPENEFLIFITQPLFLKHGSYALVISFIINFILQIDKKMGKGVLLNLLVGRYHSPREEKRIIMFLDLTSSSRIAEQLDPFAYSSLIKDFFYDIDRSILTTNGSVFQFVGDEVVVLWNIKEGVENNNCLHFFFLAKEIIQKNKPKYEAKYGLVPEFKAGIHSGKVIVTEVGGRKQEIAYHGDTVNTAARIRSECNELNKRLLISAELLSLLSDIDRTYFVESQGIFSLKGKKNVIGLFSVGEKNQQTV